MVSRNTLEKSNIEDAKKLLIAMDASNMKPSSFLWFYLSDSQSWRLIICSDHFNNKSAHDLYKEFIDLFGKKKFVKNIGLENISLINTKNDLIIILKMVIKTGPNDISGARISSSTFNNVYIEDVYIYRLS